MNNIQLIENTVIPQNLSQDEKNKRYYDIEHIVNSILPQKLYRFKTVSERSLDQLYNNDLGFSSCDALNDDYEARIYYDKKRLHGWLDSILYKENETQLFDFIRNMSQVPQEILGVAPNAEAVLTNYKGLTIEMFHDILVQLVGSLSPNIDYVLDMIIENVRQKTKIACFTEKIYSDMMWGQYACNATGFALEYEFGDNNTIYYKDEIDVNHNTWLNLFPIIYGNQRQDTTQYAKYLYQIKILQMALSSNGITDDNGIINSYLPCPDVFMATKLAIKKSYDWKQEKEWRMFLVSDNPMIVNQKYPSVKYIPSAVYIGRKISAINEKIIIDIAKEKQIPVYKMGFNDKARSYRLKAYKI